MRLHQAIAGFFKEEFVRFDFKEEGECFTFDVYPPDNMIKAVTITVSPSVMTINGVGSLGEEVILSDDSVQFGKWGKNEELQAADPNFFIQLAYFMTWVGMVVSMGWFNTRTMRTGAMVFDALEKMKSREVLDNPTDMVNKPSEGEVKLHGITDDATGNDIS